LRALVGRELRHALADCNEVLRLNPNNYRVLDRRGFAYLKLGEYARAIADYDRLLAIDAKSASALYGRGIAKARLGDARGGEADIAAAKIIRPAIADEFARYGVR
jgi:tetratricopeptide (TPR) repeat protein